MAGGPTTPELVAAVNEAGGFGYLAAGYLTPQALREALERTRELTAAPIGVNVFVPSAPDADDAALAAYAARLAPEAERLGVTAGRAAVGRRRLRREARARRRRGRAHRELHLRRPVPRRRQRLQLAGTQVAVTVTSADEAAGRGRRGADRWSCRAPRPAATRAHSRHRAEPHPTGRRPGRVAAGSACPWSRPAASWPRATPGRARGRCASRPDRYRPAVHARGRNVGGAPAALLDARYPDTVITRAFTGRWARGLANRFTAEHPDAPAGYPQVNFLTRPLRAAATKAGDADVPNLWAGTGWRAVTTEPAGQWCAASPASPDQPGSRPVSATSLSIVGASSATGIGSSNMPLPERSPYAWTSAYTPRPGRRAAAAGSRWRCPGPRREPPDRTPSRRCTAHRCRAARQVHGAVQRVRRGTRRRSRARRPPTPGRGRRRCRRRPAVIACL